MGSCVIEVVAMEFMLSRWLCRMGTWAVFIDLVKAFDSVPRDGLSAVLDKFGIPPKMRRLIVKFHSDLVVKVLVGEDDVCFESSTGVKQGCPMAPILFALYFQAANEVVDSLAPASSNGPPSGSNPRMTLFSLDAKP